MKFHWNHRRTQGTLTRQLLSLAALSAIGGTAQAQNLFNADIYNTTGNVTNDYHVRMCADSPIEVELTFEAGGDVSFDDALDNGGVENNGTTDVTINWDGATVDPGKKVHIGAAAKAKPKNLRIKESWWTLGGVKVVSAPGTSDSGRMPSGRFGDSGGGAGFRVTDSELFDDILGTNLTGEIWWEAPDATYSISNFNREGPIYLRTADLLSPNLIPIENLSPSLGGFGPFGPITLLPACGGATRFGNACPSVIDVFGQLAPGTQATVLQSNANPGDFAIPMVGVSHTSWSGLPLPLPLNLFAPSPGNCQLAVSVDFILPLQLVDPGGNTQVSLPLPPSWHSCERPIYLQWLNVNPGSGEFRASDAMGINVGN